MTWGSIVIAAECTDLAAYKAAYIFHKRNYSESPEDRAETSNNVLSRRGWFGWTPNTIQGVASVRKVRLVKF